jgi:hypothetical protein
MNVPKGQAKVGHNVKTKTNLCRCGGTVKVVSRFARGKLTPLAECDSCHATARKPKDLAND